MELLTVTIMHCSTCASKLKCNTHVSQVSKSLMMCKTRNSDFGGLVGLKLHNKAPNSDYHSAFI